MTCSSETFLGAVLVAALTSSGLSPGQTVQIGIQLAPGENVNPTGPETILNTYAQANMDGELTTATFGWSVSPCPAAAKIKIFRPSASLYRDPTLPDSFRFVGERGPFDVTAPLTTVLFFSFAVQTVTLAPPLEVQAGDVIAITNVTTCGGPVYQNQFIVPDSHVPGGSFSVSGDVTSSASNPRSFNKFVLLIASGSSTSFGLIRGRFVTSLIATDPRTGVTAQGAPVLLGDLAGYFSLPGITGDATLPEVMVKMVDASGVPELGGDFWFFHAPLTDVQYTLTVRDRLTDAVKTYSNTSGSPGQLCGGADTSAFSGLPQ